MATVLREELKTNQNNGKLKTPLILIYCTLRFSLATLLKTQCAAFKLSEDAMEQIAAGRYQGFKLISGGLTPLFVSRSAGTTTDKTPIPKQNSTSAVQKAS